MDVPDDDDAVSCMNGTHPRTALIGNAADFQDRSATAPRWEHQMLQDRLGARLIATDQLGHGRLSHLRNRYLDIDRLWRLGARLTRFDRLLAQSEASGYEAMLALSMRGTWRPLDIIFHGQRWWTRRNRMLGPLAGRLPHVRFLCLATSLRSILLEEYGVSPTRISVTGYGVDERFFRPERDAVPALVVSAGTASRDYRTLAAAAALISAPVRIAADSNWYRERLNVTEDALPGNVRVASSETYEALRALYARALFVVVPLLDVRFACGYAVVAEAMAMGKPVIVTRTGAPGDLIEDGVTGLYVPPGDVDALARTMNLLLLDPGRAQAMGVAARAAVEARMTLNLYVDRLTAAMRR